MKNISNRIWKFKTQDLITKTLFDIKLPRENKILNLDINEKQEFGNVSFYQSYLKFKNVISLDMNYLKSHTLSVERYFKSEIIEIQYEKIISENEFKSCLSVIEELNCSYSINSYIY